MPEDWLRKPLQQTDRHFARDAPAVDPQNVRSRAASQRRNRRTLQSLLLIVLAAGGFAAFFASRSSKERPTPVAISNPPKTEKAPPIVGIELSVSQRIALETQIRLDHRLTSIQASSAGSIDLAEQRSEAARIMVSIALQRQAIVGPKEAALVYQRTVTLFPETSSASAARVALAQLTPNR